jgi:predicted nucleotidyltransferase component of viral defense system
VRNRPTNLPASIHARLQNEATRSNVPFNVILQYYGIERFLYRLAQSRYARTFVLKGGVSFLAWRIPLRRYTKDIDLLAHTANDVDHIVQIFKEICQQPVTEDGIAFDPDSMTGERTQQGAPHQGVRVRGNGSLGRAVIRIQIDIGFGDEIVPAETRIDYPTILSGLPSPVLNTYSYEAVIAEKVHAMISLGSINSRMKDFYDIWLMAQERDLDGTTLQKALRNTFAVRGTPLPLDSPVALTDDFASSHQQQWQAFITSFESGSEELDDLNAVIQSISSFVLPALQATAADRPFRQTWQAGRNWSEQPAWA